MKLEDTPPPRSPRDIDTGALGVIALCPLLVLLAALVLLQARCSESAAYERGETLRKGGESRTGSVPASVSPAEVGGGRGIASLAGSNVRTTQAPSRSAREIKGSWYPRLGVVRRK
jgi:hypothetical protein